MKFVKKLLKGIFVVISVLCIAFTAFFVIAAASGHSDRIDKAERGVFALLHLTGAPVPGASSGSTSTIGMLTGTLGLTTSEAGQVMALADQMGIDTSDTDRMRDLVAKNIGNAGEIKDVMGMYQAGEITESQAKNLLRGIIDV